MTSLVAFREASSVFNLLNGVCCVYKSAGETLNSVRKTFLMKLSSELCELECKEPTTFVHIKGDTTQPMKVNMFPSFVDNPLVMGPKYVPKDFKCVYASPLGINTSGVLVFGLNNGTKSGEWLREINPIRTYRVSGRLGEAKHNLFKTGRTISSGGYNHVKQSSINSLMATLQSSHQRIMFDLCGVDTSSQAAYELASRGLIRPSNKKIPVIYSIKCVHFEPPDFVLEIHCANEYEAYLMALIHDSGVKLRTVAYCTQVQCIKHSFFTLDLALLKKHWTLEEVIANLSSCTQLLQNNKDIGEKLIPLDKNQTSVT